MIHNISWTLQNVDESKRLASPLYRFVRRWCYCLNVLCAVRLDAKHPNGFVYNARIVLRSGSFLRDNFRRNPRCVRVIDFWFSMYSSFNVIKTLDWCVFWHDKNSTGLYYLKRQTDISKSAGAHIGEPSTLKI